MYQLPKKFIEKLEELPESGMGYHKVRIIFNDNSELNGVVFNCEVLETKRGINLDNIKEINIRS